MVGHLQLFLLFRSVTSCGEILTEALVLEFAPTPCPKTAFSLGGLRPALQNLGQLHSLGTAERPEETRRTWGFSQKGCISVGI